MEGRWEAPRNLQSNPSLEGLPCPIPTFLYCLQLLILLILLLCIQHWTGRWGTTMNHPDAVPALPSLESSKQLEKAANHKCTYCSGSKAQWATEPWTGSLTQPAVREHPEGGGSHRWAGRGQADGRASVMGAQGLARRSGRWARPQLWRPVRPQGTRSSVTAGLPPAQSTSSWSPSKSFPLPGEAGSG